jgi:uncharacterized protein with PIN domain
VAKCPKCDKGFIYLNEETVKIGPQQHLAASVAYVCPHCDTIIGFGPDLEEIQKIVGSAIAKAISRRS